MQCAMPSALYPEEAEPQGKLTKRIMKKRLLFLLCMTMATATVAQDNGALNFSSSEVDVFLLNETDAGKNEQELFNKALTGSVDDCIRYINSNPLITDSKKVRDRILSAAKTVEDYGKVANALPDKRTMADYNARNLILGEQSFTIGGSSGTKSIADAEAYLKYFSQGTYAVEMRQFVETEREKERQRIADEERRERYRKFKEEEAKHPRNWTTGRRLRSCDFRLSGWCISNCTPCITVIFLNFIDNDLNMFQGQLLKIDEVGAIFKEKPSLSYNGQNLYEGEVYLFETYNFTKLN
jgi:hypothetical protein